VDAVVLDEDGLELTDAVGELAIRQPMPSMPVKFWNDPGDARYMQTYFGMYPGLWRQGDFARINARGGVYLLGRSDATLNRHGVRIGTAEIYAALKGVPELADSMILGIDRPDGSYWMPLFVTLKAGYVLDEKLKSAIPPPQNDIVSAPRARRYPRLDNNPLHPHRQTPRSASAQNPGGNPLEKALAGEAFDDLAAINQLLEIANTL
jgi:acetoacetyl-CoA synthetase